jgi:hypothetical protein
MSERRRRKRYYIDAGEGITLATTLRSPPDPETVEAFKALAHAAAKHIGAPSDCEAVAPETSASARPSVSADTPPEPET